MTTPYHTRSFDQFRTERHESMDTARPSTAVPAVQPQLTQGRENAATRRARTRFWPDLSDQPSHFPSLARRRDELQGHVVEIRPGRDSGRNMMAIFDDIDSTPRTKFNIRCKNGRSKQLWPHWHDVKDVNIPMGLTLKHLCRFYPLHCWGDGLRMFMAEGWTAEQIWKELPHGARCHGASTRPWNYLQQAMGREADKMYEEAGNVKRVPIKRKRGDDDDNVANGRASDLGGQSPQSSPQALYTDPSRHGARRVRRCGSRDLFDKSATDLGASPQQPSSSPLSAHSPHRGFNGESSNRPSMRVNMMNRPTSHTPGFYPLPAGPSNAKHVRLSTMAHSNQQPAQYWEQSQLIDPRIMEQTQYQQSATRPVTCSSTGRSPNNAAELAAQRNTIRSPAATTNLRRALLEGHFSTSQSQAPTGQFSANGPQGRNPLPWPYVGQYITENSLVQVPGFEPSALPSRDTTGASAAGTFQQPDLDQPSLHDMYMFGDFEDGREVESEDGGADRAHGVLSNTMTSRMTQLLGSDEIVVDENHRHEQRHSTPLFFEHAMPAKYDFSSMFSGGDQEPATSVSEQQHTDDSWAAEAEEMRAAMIKDGFDV